MRFTREINRLMLVMLLAFLGIGVTSTYWSTLGADDILSRDDNPRVVEDVSAIRRGAIYDRNETQLVVSRLSETGILERNYAYDAMNSALGYFSLRYGVGGAEAAYDAILRGDTLPENFNTLFAEDVLHRPRVGSDVRLTLDLTTQQAAVTALENQRGAIVMMRVPDGDVLALVSQPTFDPNTLDADWDTLIEAPENPFFNRALQGQYQPGGIWQTPLIATTILTDYTPTQASDLARNPVQVGDVTLNCALSPDEVALTIAQAYTYGCPQPFDAFIAESDETLLQEIITTFQLDGSPQLQDFIVEDSNTITAEITPEATEVITESVSLRDNLLGQGNLTTNPLSMARIMAAVINGGNAPSPYVLQATRAPEADWEAARPIIRSEPFMTATTARRLRELLIQNMTILVDDLSDSATFGGHVALAFSGEETQTWFIGFMLTENNAGQVIAIVLEDTTDPLGAATLGIELLRTTADLE